MLVVRIELWSAVTGEKTEIGRMYVANDGTSERQDRGDYTAKVCRRGSFEYPGWDNLRPVREGSVRDYPRLSYNVWRLVSRALRACFPEERGD
jgi:hypothetical protein